MISIDVIEESQVASARREAQNIAKRQGMSEVDAGRVALVTTELATNLIKHGGGGEVLTGAYQEGEETGVEVIALDRGKGMADVQSCLADGYSSVGTSGRGLGAVVRQSSYVDIASSPDVGTAILCRIRAGTAKQNRSSPFPHFGAVSIAKTGEEVCGDAWAVDPHGSGATLFVADGLGHGTEAAQAAVEGVRLFHRYIGHKPPTLLDYIHGGLRATRGAAVSVARYDPVGHQIIFAGIGNVAGVLSSGSDLRRMVSMPGTAGYDVRKIQAFNYPFAGGLVILCSDGLSTSWTTARYHNLAGSHPTLIAAILYRDFGRRRDDVTVLVGKWTSSD
jgi:anti-sigma regulatory factor (Ser/Thr protein kinase)